MQQKVKRSIAAGYAAWVAISMLWQKHIYFFEKKCTLRRTCKGGVNPPKRSRAALTQVIVPLIPPLFFRGGAVGGGVCAGCELEIGSNVFVELPPQRCCGLTALHWEAKC